MSKANGIDLGSLSVADLRDLIDSAHREIGRRERQRVKEVRGEMMRLAGGLGLTPEQVLDMDRSGRFKQSAVPAKYRNPANPEQAWSGRGKRPRWLQSALEQGAKLEDFAA